MLISPLRQNQTLLRQIVEIINFSQLPVAHLRTLEGTWWPRRIDGNAREAPAEALRLLNGTRPRHLPDSVSVNPLFAHRLTPCMLVLPRLSLSRHPYPLEIVLGILLAKSEPRPETDYNSP